MTIYENMNIPAQEINGMLPLHGLFLSLTNQILLLSQLVLPSGYSWCTVGPRGLLKAGCTEATLTALLLLTLWQAWFCA